MQVIHPKQKDAGLTDGPFVDMLLGLMRSPFPKDAGPRRAGVEGLWRLAQRPTQQ
jgi:hypothetical protein